MTNVYDDIPTTFEGMYTSADWSRRFLGWAEEQPDWSGALTRAVWAMRDWQGGSVAEADQIVADLNAATPPIDANETLTKQQPFAWVDDNGNVPGDYFAGTYEYAYGILAGDPFIYAAFYADHNQTLANNAVAGKQHFEAKRGVPEDERTQEVERYNVWIRDASGEAVIMASSEFSGPENMGGDMWFEITSEIVDMMERENKRELDELEDGGTANFGQWYDLILIGDRWKGQGWTDGGRGSLRQVCEWYGSTGTVTIEKGSTFSRGSLTFTGAHDQSAVENHIGTFSKKTCYFE